MTNQNLRTLATSYRKTRDSLESAKIMSEVPKNKMPEFLAILEELKTIGGAPVEPYINKNKEHVGYLVRCKGTGKKGHYISNDLIANLPEFVRTIEEYFTK